MDTLIDRIAKRYSVIFFNYVGGGEKMTYDTEELRRCLLEEIYAGAAAGMGAMLLDEGRIRRADDEELREIAAQYGIR